MEQTLERWITILESLHLCFRISPFGAPTVRGVSVDDEVYEALERLSAERNQPVAGVSLSLIEQALEYQEDVYFSRVADERLNQKKKRALRRRQKSLISNREGCGPIAQ